MSFKNLFNTTLPLALQRKKLFGLSIATSCFFLTMMAPDSSAQNASDNAWKGDQEIASSLFNDDVMRALSDFSRRDKTFNPGTVDQNFDTFSLSEAIEVAISTNPEIGLLASNKNATAKELEQAEALYFPSVDLSADTGVEYSDNPVAAGVQDEEETLGRYSTSLTITQLLYDGGGTFHEKQRQKARVLSAANRQREGAELIGLSVVEFYLEIIRRRELLQIAYDNVNTHRQIMGDIQGNVESGIASRADLLQVQVRLEDALATVNDVKRQLQVARANFKREVGARPYNLVSPTPPRDLLSTNIEQEVYQAVDSSPTLSIFQADVKVAEAEIEAAKSSLFPELNFQVNGRTGDNLNGVQGNDHNASALLVMNWNLYRGGGDTARIEEFKHRHSRAKEEFAEASREVENEVRTSWADLTAADKRLQNFTRQANTNKELVAAYKDQFFANRRTLLDVLDSQNELFVSRSAAVNEKYIGQFTVYRLLSLKGQLLDALDVKLSERI